MAEDLPAIVTGSPSTTAAARRRRGWVAFLLSLVGPGVGQLYAGYPRRALFFYVLRFALGVGGVAILSLHRLAPWNVRGYWLYASAAMLVAPVDAIFAARRQSQPYELRRFNRWYVYGGCIVLLFGVSFGAVKGISALGRVFVDVLRMPSGSMERTLLLGDILLVDSLAYGVRLPGRENESWHLADPRRGDLVTFPFPHDRSKLFLKRIIGLPGETIEIRGPVVYIDGGPLIEPYALHMRAVRPALTPAEADLLGESAEKWGPAVIPAGQYFVLGDNRDNSLDSRSFGFVARADILGRVRSVYWSAEASRADYARDGDRPLFRPIRWSRIGLRVE